VLQPFYISRSQIAELTTELLLHEAQEGVHIRRRLRCHALVHNALEVLHHHTAVVAVDITVIGIQSHLVGQSTGGRSDSIFGVEVQVNPQKLSGNGFQKIR
jgi:hypothetical protein